MNPLYNAGINLYRIGARLAAMKSRKVRHMLAGQGETLKRLAAFRADMAPDGFDLWVHAASLGEFEQGRPLIEGILASDPAAKILLTFFSPSGYEVRCDFDPRVAVVYLPFDTPSLVSGFLDAAQPRMAVFVKYEFWGNYLSELKRRGIPTYIISAIFRPSQLFFKPWGGMFRRMLGCFTHIYVQNEASRQLLEGIGVTNVTVAGDTRFDRVTTIRDKGRDIPEIELFKRAVSDSFTLVAGSSWGADEDMYIDTLRQLPDVRAIIAPHEFDKDRLAAMRRRLGSDSTMLFSDFRRIYALSPAEAAKTAAKLKYLIIDSFGLLSSIYRYADAAYIGGGFGAGIHNINEAAVYGIPVIFGPNNKKFVEAQELQACGGGFEVKSKADVDAIIRRITSDSDFRHKVGHAAGEYIASKVGATPIILKDLSITENRQRTTNNHNIP